VSGATAGAAAFVVTGVFFLDFADASEEPPPPQAASTSASAPIPASSLVTWP
jgi:hypothetical protein